MIFYTWNDSVKLYLSLFELWDKYRTKWDITSGFFSSSSVFLSCSTLDWKLQTNKQKLMFTQRGQGLQIMLLKHSVIISTMEKSYRLKPCYQHVSSKHREGKEKSTNMTQAKSTEWTWWAQSLLTDIFSSPSIKLSTWQILLGEKKNFCEIREHPSQR